MALLDDIAGLSDEIITLNKKYSNGSLLSGSPESAINTASYYDDIADQGSSIFKTIIQNHMFENGNKRTAVDFLKSFAEKNSINIRLSSDELLDLATKIANKEVSEVSEITKLIRGLD